jgi:hypothetical protein
MNKTKDKENELQDENTEETACYVGICPEHNWETMRRSNFNDAYLDLEAHRDLFPEETHTGSKVISC